jgi:hypothetical protein
MSPTVNLDSAHLRLEPGTSAKVPLQIRNSGQIVEGYHIEVVGTPAAWTTVDPPDVTLFPGGTTTVTLDFHPPRSSAVLAGEHEYAVRVVPTEHPEETVVPEGAVEVLPFVDTTAELVPHTSRGRRGARHQVAIDNRGNVPTTVALSGTDQADSLIIRIKPTELDIPPGHAAFADVRVRPAVTVWRGAPVTHAFTVIVSEEETPKLALDGTHLQEPLIPGWLPKAVLAGLAALAALAVVWAWVLKPTVASAAKDAVQPQVQQVAKAAKQVDAQTKQAAVAAADAKKNATDAGKSADKSAKNAGTATATITDAFNTRLALSTAEGSTTARPPYVIPAKNTFSMTDFVFENPQGDFGTVTLALRNPNGTTTTLFNTALENFRNLDYHFVTPIVAGEKTQILMTVRCNKVGAPPNQTPAPTRCSTAIYLGGEMAKPRPKP